MFYGCVALLARLERHDEEENPCKTQQLRDLLAHRANGIAAASGLWREGCSHREELLDL
jgi:hypothetical protein